MGADDVAASRWAPALARKYTALVALRMRRDARGQAATREELRALAAEFPGCLRELDTLGRQELIRRAEAATAVAKGAAAEPWMAWIAAYHELMVQTLAARARGKARAHRPSGTLAPSGGRLNVTVLRALAARFGVPATTIARTLFPVRRPSPYSL